MLLSCPPHTGQSLQSRTPHGNDRKPAVPSGPDSAGRCPRRFPFRFHAAARRLLFLPRRSALSAGRSPRYDSGQGLLLRDSEADERYEDGTLADYYAIIRNGLEQKIPSILIEHAFVDSEMDYRKFLNSDEKIKRNAEADARALARYYQLEKKDGSGVLPQLANVKEKMTLIKDEQPEHNEISYQVFYEQKKDNSMTDTTTDKRAGIPDCSSCS